eukprot:1160291-Pelagomonas_calceolata.AAC.4
MHSAQEEGKRKGQHIYWGRSFYFCAKPGRFVQQNHQYRISEKRQVKATMGGCCCVRICYVGGLKNYDAIAFFAIPKLFMNSIAA